MTPLYEAITNWALQKIQDYKTDNLKMTIEEATNGDLYSARLATISFLEQECAKRLSKKGNGYFSGFITA